MCIRRMSPAGRDGIVRKEIARMEIERHQLVDGTNFKPIISRVVAHRDRVYVCGITGDPVGDVTVQTRQALGRIDQLLAQAGTDTSKLLTAQVWLSDMALFRTHNLAWNEWVDPANPRAPAWKRS